MLDVSEPGLGHPRVGIVMPTRGQALWLCRALESVRGQSYAEWELVIVDRCSAASDAAWVIGQAFAEELCVPVRMIRRPGNHASAVNAGLSMLGTELAVVHDDVDTWSPRFLETMVRVYSREHLRHPEIRGVACRAQTVVETVTEGPHVHVDGMGPYPRGGRTPLPVGRICVDDLPAHSLFPDVAFLFDRRAGESVGFYDENLPALEGWGFHLRFLIRHAVWMHPECLAFLHLPMG